MRATFAAGWALCVALCLALGLWAPLPARAQSRSELERSRELFEQGLAAAHADRWEEARALFERALAITERPSILLNLAGAQAETGELVGSATSYQRFLEIATGRDARHRTEATRALARVQARTPHLELEVVGLREGDQVMLDDRVLTREELTAPVAIDPGAHRVTVQRDGRQVASEAVSAAEGARAGARVEVRELRVVRTEPVRDEVPAAATTDTGGDDGLAIGLGIGIGAAVVVAIVVGVVVGTSQGTGATYVGNVGDGVIRF